MFGFNLLTTLFYFMVSTAPDLPSKPEEFRLLRCSAVSVDLEWTSGWNGGLPQTFMLQLQETDYDSDFMHVFKDIPDPGNGHQVRYKLDEVLKPGTEYLVKLYSVNSLGKSDKPATLIISTKEKPAFDVSSMKITWTRRETEAKLTWEPPVGQFRRLSVGYKSDNAFVERFVKRVETSQILKVMGRVVYFFMRMYDSGEVISEVMFNQDKFSEFRHASKEKLERADTTPVQSCTLPGACTQVVNSVLYE